MSFPRTMPQLGTWPHALEKREIQGPSTTKHGLLAPKLGVAVFFTINAALVVAVWSEVAATHEGNPYQIIISVLLTLLLTTIGVLGKMVLNRLDKGSKWMESMEAKFEASKQEHAESSATTLQAFMRLEMRLHPDKGEEIVDELSHLLGRQPARSGPRGG